MQSTVLITGANRGVGLALSRHYQGQGWRVIGCCRDPRRAAELGALGADLQILDAADPASISDLARRIAGQPLDLVIANAGVLGDRRALGDIDSDDFLHTMRVNALGPLLLAEALAATLAAGRGKRFVAISSRMGSIANGLKEGDNVTYRCSKAALNMVVATLACQWRAAGIAVAAVHPGWAKTDMGGPLADVPVADAAAGIYRVIAALTPATSGGFWSWTGEAIPW